MNAGARTCPRCSVLLEVLPDPTGAFLEVCPSCDGVLVESGELERALRGRLPRASVIDLPSPFATSPEARVCPVCTAAALDEASLEAASRGALRCASCGAHFFDARSFLALRRDDESPGPVIDTEGLELELPAPRPSRVETPTVAAAEALRVPTGPIPDLRDDERDGLREFGSELAHARFDMFDPRARLFGIPTAFALALPFAFTDFGSLLGMPIRIQFHEFGHALLAWLSGRFAIPMPCGLTVWTDPPSVGAHLVMLLIAALLVVRGVRTKRPGFPIAAALIELAHLLVATRDDSIAAILLAGGASELALPALVLVGFFVPMPDRLRWDFFRFPAAFVAAVGYLGSMRLWLAVLTGREEAPIGSLFGTAGDGSGDLERLVLEHGFSLDRIVHGYVALGVAAGFAVVAVYAWFAARAVVDLRDARG